MIWLKLWLIILLIVATCAEFPPIKILGIFHTASAINFRNSMVLMDYLAYRGHEITIIAPFPRPKTLNSTIKLIEIDNVPENAQFPDQYDMAQTSLTNTYKKHIEISVILGETIIKHAKTVAMLQDKTIKFDLVMHEVMCGDIMLAFSEYYNAHAVGLSMHGTTKWATDLVGSPVPMSYIPNVLLPYDENMSFFERIHNAYATIYEHFSKHHTYLEATEDLQYSITKFKYLKPISSLRTAVSMVFVNTHFTIDFPRPYVPNLIEVGGFHFMENRTGIHKINNELEAFMSDTSHGVVYVSLGESTKLPNTLIHELIKAFSQFPHKFLLKFNGKRKPTSLPSNVYLNSWLPQQDILQRPNTVLFITHGGLLSIMEALHFKKPIIGIPIVGDQFLRVKSAVKFGYGLYLNMGNISIDSLVWALDEVLYNDVYSKNAKKVGDRFNDRPYEPKENINNLLQYVVRTNGAKQMHNAGQELKFMQFHNIDVGLIYFMFFILLLFVVSFIVFVCKVISGIFYPSIVPPAVHID